MDEEKKVNGWRDVQITAQMPLDVIVNFFNVLNQRLCALEDVTTTIGPNGKAISLTDLYALQAEEALRQQAETEKEPAPEQPEEQA